MTRRGAAWLKLVDERDKAGKRAPRNTPGAASEPWRRAGAPPAGSEARPASGRSRSSFAGRVLGDDDEVVLDGLVDDDLFVAGQAGEREGSVRRAATEAVRRASGVPTGQDGPRRGPSRGTGTAQGSRGRRRSSKRPDVVGTSEEQSPGARPVSDHEVGLDAEVRSELARVVPPTQRRAYEAKLKDASRAFQADRFGDAARILKKLAEQAPGLPSVRELYGLALYRQGRWRQAARELEAYRLLDGSVEEHPVLADCYRALRDWDAVEGLWDELRAASPSAELVVEGRIVTAGAHADRGDLSGAIALVEQGWKLPKRPREHHLRRAYALGDLYERAGEVTRARQLFEWISHHSPDFADAQYRAHLLGGS